MEIARSQTFHTLHPPDIKVLVDDVIKSDDVIQENGSDMDIPILYRDINGEESTGHDIRCSTFRSELSGKFFDFLSHKKIQFNLKISFDLIISCWIVML